MNLQYGILEWTTFSGFKNYHNIYWLAPVMSFSVIVGVALDYDGTHKALGRHSDVECTGIMMLLCCIRCGPPGAALRLYVDGEGKLT